MKRKKGLVIVHIDGLSATHLQRAMDRGFMGYTKKLLDKEDYVVSRYRTGLPSVTPYAQAGILYGNNDNIPSFYWWDKETGSYIRFGQLATFSQVAHKYFKKHTPLTLGGACISACYPAGAKQTFALAFRREQKDGETMRWQLVWRWIINPLYVIDWAYYSSLILLKTVLVYTLAKLRGKQVSELFVLGNLLDELFLHHLTRFATHLAMEQNFPVIYAAFYPYDETAHAFGPDDPFSYRMLSEVDNTIKYIMRRRNRKGKQKRDYEVVILSDHGQVPTIPFKDRVGKKLGQKIADFLPTYEVDENKDSTKRDPIRTDGHIQVAYSGSMAQVYFKDISWRLSYKEIQKRFPGFIQKLIGIKEIGFLMVKDGRKDLLITQKKQFYLTKKLTKDVETFLSSFDEPAIVAKQLQRLNSFSKSGDILLFGAWIRDKQINFEHQAGGHGGLGGEQTHPFIALKKEWKLKTDNIHDASGVHFLLNTLLKRLSI